MPSSMKPFLWTLFAALSAFGSPLDVVLDARTTCNPNFEGAGLSVAIGAFEWGVPAVAPNTRLVATAASAIPAAEFHFQQNGQSPPGYIIRHVNNNNLAVTLSNPSGTLFLTQASDSGNNVLQTWLVDCATCSTGISSAHGVVASGCTIRTQFNGGNLCVRLGNVNPEPLFVTPCIAGQANQLFTFSTV